MFWKKKDGYESCNGGDYIRPTEEYRADCEEYYEHGQTYSDYDSRINNEEYRINCSEYTHGQTYSDYNSEQRSYDKHSELEGKFAPYLMGGEYILWCGRAEKNATAKEKGVGFGKSGDGCLPILLIMIVFFLPLGILGLIIYLMVTIGISKRSYAITNKGVLIIQNQTLNRVPLKSIRGITYNASDRNIGYVTFYTNTVNDNSTSGNSSMTSGIFAVKDPRRVAAILRKAMADYR